MSENDLAKSIIAQVTHMTRIWLRKDNHNIRQTVTINEAPSCPLQSEIPHTPLTVLT